MPRFAARGDVYLRDIADPKKKVKQILWGDWLNIEAETDDGWSKVKWGKDRYWIRTSDCEHERPLEVMFIDVGQGDGCLVVTPKSPPDEKVILIDAGEGDNMYRFIRWRFGKLKKKFNFHAAIVTHPDQDHYKGFQKLFEEKQFSFDRVLSQRHRRTRGSRCVWSERCDRPLPHRFEANRRVNSQPLC
jgi:beta-lactamase superfamily II metal-dependent hydrolase